MKNIILLAFLALHLFAKDEIDTLIKEIKEKKHTEIKNLAKNPFLSGEASVKYKHQEKSEQTLVILQSILGDTALINNRWYKKGDSFMGMKITEVKEKYILLANKSHTKKLELAQERYGDKIQIGVSK
ncbi:MAG: hypothetical protein ACTTIC_04630 [Helicobacteraceae bacterium]